MTSTQEAVAEASFEPKLFAFLSDLREHNNRDWFAANKSRYEQALLEPALAFIEDFAPHLTQISPHFRAEAKPVGGSLFRIYRDTRFSKDKTPYKTSVGIHFRHERARDAHTPGFYLHLACGEVFAGGGIWRPDTKSVTLIRRAIASEPDAWTQATLSGAFADRLDLRGDALKRPPQGFEPRHALIEDIKRKSFFGIVTLRERDVCAPGFLEEYATICRSAAPLVRFICSALDLPY
jgi:uncharacterized protein (TIGR02453 family)